MLSEEENAFSAAYPHYELDKTPGHASLSTEADYGDCVGGVPPLDLIENGGGDVPKYADLRTGSAIEYGAILRVSEKSGLTCVNTIS